MNKRAPDPHGRCLGQEKRPPPSGAGTFVAGEGPAPLAAGSYTAEVARPGRCDEEAACSRGNFLESPCFAVKLGLRERRKTRAGGKM